MTKRKQPTEEAIAAWLVQTCTLFGASLSTGHRVAAEFLKGLESDRTKRLLVDIEGQEGTGKTSYIEGEN